MQTGPYAHHHRRSGVRPSRQDHTERGTGASVTPTGTVGADAVMAWTLRDRVGLRESLPSLLIVKTTSTASQGLFLLLGILIARWTLSSSLALVRVMEWLLLLEVIGVVGFV